MSLGGFCFFCGKQITNSNPSLYSKRKKNGVGALMQWFLTTRPQSFSGWALISSLLWKQNFICWNRRRWLWLWLWLGKSTLSSIPTGSCTGGLTLPRAPDSPCKVVHMEGEGIPMAVHNSMDVYSGASFAGRRPVWSWRGARSWFINTELQWKYTEASDDH